MYDKNDEEQGKNTVFVMSLDQLINLNIWKSISAFAALGAGEGDGCFSSMVYGVSWFTTVSWYALDSLCIGQIEKLKTGEIDKKEFFDYLRGCCYLVTNQELLEAWNKMCEIDDNAMTNINSLHEVLKKHTNAHILVVSATSKMHKEHIIEGMRKKNEDCGLGNHQQIHFALSYEQETTALSELACKGLSTMEEYHVVSLHKGFCNPLALGIEGKRFSYHTYDSSKETLGKCIENYFSQL